MIGLCEVCGALSYLTFKMFQGYLLYPSSPCRAVLLFHVIMPRIVMSRKMVNLLVE